MIDGWNWFVKSAPSSLRILFPSDRNVIEIILFVLGKIVNLKTFGQSFVHFLSDADAKDSSTAGQTV